MRWWQRPLSALSAVLLVSATIAFASPSVAGADGGDAPTNVVASPNAHSATVTWDAPDQSGVTSYEVTATPGGQTCTPSPATATTCTVFPLTQNTSYQFTVTATYEGGSQATSTDSNTVVPGQTPAAPTNVVATAGYEDASISWSAPGDEGSSPVSSYQVTASPGGATCTYDVSTTDVPEADTCQISGLSNETSYSFTVSATNATGTGPSSSASNAVTPPVVATIPVGPEPRGISSDGKHVWVGNAGDASITELNAATGATVQTLDVLRTSPRAADPFGMDSDGVNVWAEDFDAPLAEFNATTGALEAEYGVGSGPRGPSSNGTDTFVANSYDNSVSEIDNASRSYVRTIWVGNCPNEVSTDGTDAWVINSCDGSVSEIDANSGAVVRTIRVGSNPEGIASNGTDVWVANQGSNSVSEIQASTGTVINTIDVGGAPDAVSIDGSSVWVTNSGDNTVSEIDPTSGTVVATIPVGNDPDAISSDGSHVWVANYGDSTVSEIDTGSTASAPPAPSGVHARIASGSSIEVR